MMNRHTFSTTLVAGGGYEYPGRFRQDASADAWVGSFKCAGPKPADRPGAAVSGRAAVLNS